MIVFFFKSLPILAYFKSYISCDYPGHTRELPQQNATSDTQINQISLEQERVVITKDYDFVDSFMTIQKPFKLLLITTGNIRNKDLELIFSKNLSSIVELLQNHSYIEINRNEIIVHQ